MYYPVSLRVSEEPCLVVGGGPVALRKAQGLLKAGARVTVVSPEFAPGFRRLRVRREARAFRPSDAAGVFLVISATDDPRVNRAVHHACQKRGTLVNVVDQPDLCTFIAPSVVRRGAVTVAISTEGQAPGLAKALRKHFERLTPRSIGRVTRKLGAARRKILKALTPSPARTRLLKGLVRRLTFGKARPR